LRILFAAAAAALVSIAGCATPSTLTAKATGCRTGDIDIIDSEYKREGSTTAWCARCQSKVYNCVSNPARDRVACREAEPGGPCH